MEISRIAVEKVVFVKFGKLVEAYQVFSFHALLS